MLSVPSRCSFFFTFTKSVSVRIFLWYIINSYFWNLFNPLRYNGLIMNQQILSRGKYYDFYVSQQYIFGTRSLISILLLFLCILLKLRHTQHASFVFFLLQYRQRQLKCHWWRRESNNVSTHEPMKRVSKMNAFSLLSSFFFFFFFFSLSFALSWSTMLEPPCKNEVCQAECNNTRTH